MKQKIVFILLFLNVLPLQAQTYSEYIQKADSCYRISDFSSSVKYYSIAFQKEHSKASHLYNAACAASMADETTKAFKWLDWAIDNGYESLSYLKKDSDLEKLHSQKKWRELIAKLQKKLDVIEVNYDKPLQKELLTIFEDDQKIRKEYMIISKKADKKSLDSISNLMIYQDSINLIKIIKILDERGWVGKNLVGGQASQALFLVIQHADLKDQQKYLPMMREAVKKGNANPGSLALLEDRVALREGRKQIYGSQLAFNPETNKPFLFPLEDPDHVDEKRAGAGLEPLADYLKKMNIIWNVETYKKELPEIEKYIKDKKI